MVPSSPSAPFVIPTTEAKEAKKQRQAHLSKLAIVLIASGGAAVVVLCLTAGCYLIALIAIKVKGRRRKEHQRREGSVGMVMEMGRMGKRTATNTKTSSSPCRSGHS